MRRWKQRGVPHVLMGGPPIPWEESAIRALMERLKTGGLSLGNMMMVGFRNAIYATPRRDEEIGKVRQSIRAAGKARLSVIEYHCYAHRLRVRHFEETEGAGPEVSGMHYDLSE